MSNVCPNNHAEIGDRHDSERALAIAQEQLPVSAAADECFARTDVAELDCIGDDR
jgi:hypothetical protein